MQEWGPRFRRIGSLAPRRRTRHADVEDTSESTALGEEFK